MVDSSSIQELISAIKQEPTDNENKYTATVARIDDSGVIWVNLSGSEKETPTESTSAEVSKGDVVTVEWRSNKLYIAGNDSNPSAGIIRVAEVEAAAATANEAAASAVADAGVAREAAEDAKATADSVHDIAVAAQTDAGVAKTAATQTMVGLSQVEDVVGTLDWITSHAKDTKDEEAASGKSYYIKNADGTFTLVTDTTDKNPSEEGWYELDEAIQNYIMSHLALTDEGLYVMSDGSEWKVLIKSDGVYIINPNGENVAQYKDSITIGTSLISAIININANTISMIAEDMSPVFTVRATTGSIKNKIVLSTSTSAFLGGRLKKDFSQYTRNLYAGDSIYVDNLRNDWNWVDGLYNPEKELTSCTISSVTRGTAKYQRTNPSSITSIWYPRVIWTYPEFVFKYGTPASYITEINISYTYTYDGSSFSRSAMLTSTIQYDGDGIITITPSRDDVYWSSIVNQCDDIYTVHETSTAPSFTLGTRAGITEGALSITAGESLYAESARQSAFGRFNEQDTSNKYAFQIGNGTDNDNRSNAFATTWDGDVHMYIDENAASGTDYEIMTALKALGWEDCIV